MFVTHGSKKTFCAKMFMIVFPYHTAN